MLPVTPMQQLWADICNVYKSKTIWFHSVIAAIVIFIPELADALPQLQPYVPDNMFKYLTEVSVIGGIILRFFTSTKLSDK
jgi:hypothetical protein